MNELKRPGLNDEEILREIFARQNPKNKELNKELQDGKRMSGNKGGNKKSPQGTPSKAPVVSQTPQAGARGPSPKVAKAKKSKRGGAPFSPLKVLSKLLLIAFLTYSIFWVACTPDVESDKFCPIPTAVRYRANEALSAVGPRLEPLRVLAQEKIVTPFLVPAYTQARAIADPQLAKVTKVYDDFSKTEQGQKLETLVLSTLTRFREAWHKVSVSFVEEVLPTVAKQLAKVTDKVAEWIPVVREKVALGARQVRSLFKAHSPAVTEPLFSAFSSSCKTTDRFFKDLLSSPTFKSLGEQPVVKEMLTQYQTLLQPTVTKAWTTAKTKAQNLFVTLPGSSFNFVWRLLENDVSSAEWGALFGGSAPAKPANN